MNFTKHFNDLASLCKDAENDTTEYNKNIEYLNELTKKQKLSHKSFASNITLRTQLNLVTEETQQKMKVFKEILEKIQEIRTKEEAAKFQGVALMRRGILMSLLQECAYSLPLWVGEVGENVPNLCGNVPASPDTVLTVGTRVAVLISNNNHNKQNASFDDTINDETSDVESWILAEVMEVNDKSSTYTVEDIDIEEGKQQFHLKTDKIIPLPIWKVDPTLYPEALFDKGSHVLGLYPQTTCFYKAIVKETPMTINDEYSLFFEDPSYPEGFAPALKIPQKYVISEVNVLGRK